MLRLTIPEGIDKPVPVYQGRSLEAGKEYACGNRFVGQLLLGPYKVRLGERNYALRTLLKVKDWDRTKPSLGPEADWNDRDLWLERGGGYGDLLCMIPTIEAILDRWPDCRLHVACGLTYWDLFYGLNVTCEMTPVPFSDDLQIISFEELIEGDPMAEELHMIDMYAHRAGIELSSKKIFYKIKDEELDRAVRVWPKNSKPRIGVQLLASSFYRCYPKISDVIVELAKENEVFIFGNPGQVKITPLANMVNVMEYGLTFRQSAALLSTCDVCVSPDSAFVHLSSALDIPCVALYGPIPSHLRVSSDKCHGIDGKAPCAPCFFHANLATDFPPNKPCAKVQKCVALDAIPVETVVEEVQRFLKSAL